MHERKTIMFDKSDAFLLLPGGVGSMDEFFEILTWAHLELHQKPIIIVNAQSYWQPVLTLIDHFISLGFADEAIWTHIEITTDTDNTISKLNKL